MMQYRVGDHVILKGSDSSLEEHSEWVVVHLEGSTLMLKRDHQVICGIHPDEVAPSPGRVKSAPAVAAGTGGRAVLLA